MNENNTNQTISSLLPNVTEKKHPAITRATVPLETKLYDEIAFLLPELSNHIGSKVNMPTFLRKVIVENWQDQFARYRKLNPSNKRRPS